MIRHGTWATWRTRELLTEIKCKKHIEGGSREGLLGGNRAILLKHAVVELGNPELIWS